MWLHNDERRLLSGYYALVQDVDEEKAYEISSLQPLLTKACQYASIREYGPSASGDESASINDQALSSHLKAYIDERARIRRANRILEARGLIKSRDYQHVGDVILISLTTDGYDLGRKYSSWWARSGLWFEEYRNHWFWLIIAFFGGILGALLVEIATKLLLRQ
ncbi:MAG: hypothetical protein WD069_03870 [Planctomycetales bacterium]